MVGHPELIDGRARQRIERDEHSKLLGGAVISERVRQHHRTWTRSACNSKLSGLVPSRTGQVAIAHEELHACNRQVESRLRR
jgi:hypothetical protein